MTELTTCLLILVIIIQSVTLFFVIRRVFATRRGQEPKKLPMRKITRDACEKLGGSVKDGRCIIKTVEKDRETIIDIGGVI